MPCRQLSLRCHQWQLGAATRLTSYPGCPACRAGRSGASSSVRWLPSALCALRGTPGQRSCRRGGGVTPAATAVISIEEHTACGMQLSALLARFGPAFLPPHPATCVQHQRCLHNVSAQWQTLAALHVRATQAAPDPCLQVAVPVLLVALALWGNRLSTALPHQPALALDRHAGWHPWAATGRRSCHRSFRAGCPLPAVRQVTAAGALASARTEGFCTCQN